MCSPEASHTIDVQGDASACQRQHQILCTVHALTSCVQVPAFLGRGPCTSLACVRLHCFEEQLDDTSTRVPIKVLQGRHVIGTARQSVQTDTF